MKRVQRAIKMIEIYLMTYFELVHLRNMSVKENSFVFYKYVMNSYCLHLLKLTRKQGC